jgi:hypothetical protein
MRLLFEMWPALDTPGGSRCIRNIRYSLFKNGEMSTPLLSLAKENPWPGLAVASLNLVVALSLVGLSLLLGVAISLIAWLHALVDREAVPIRPRAERRANP